MSRPQPVNSPVDYDISDLFFSTTDERGIIRSGNDVFVSVSGYSKDELMSKPHSIIRHPDMPRAVFRLVWSYLKSEKPIVGYVKNLAKNGRYYWVLAFLQPIPGGYLSIRLKPTSDVFKLIDPLYREMLAAEDRGGMDAATELLVNKLKELGFECYDDFMIYALNEELKSADRLMSDSRAGKEKRSTARPSGQDRGDLSEVFARAQALFDEIGSHNQKIFGNIDSFMGIGRLVNERLKNISVLTTSLGRVSINTAIHSERIGVRGACLSVVAGLIQKTSEETSGQAKQIDELATSLVSEARHVAFNIGAAKIQIEMVRRFLAELAASAGDGTGLSQLSPESLQEVQRNLDHLVAALTRCTEVVNRSIFEFGRRMGRLGTLIGQLEEQVMTLEVARKSGVIESRRIGKDGDAFNVLLSQIGAMVNEERQKLNEFTSAIRVVERAASVCESVGSLIAHRADEANRIKEGLSHQAA